MRVIYDNYSGQELTNILNHIECLKLDYDETIFLMEDIEEAILIDLGYIQDHTKGIREPNDNISVTK